MVKANIRGFKPGPTYVVQVKESMLGPHCPTVFKDREFIGYGGLAIDDDVGVAFQIIFNNKQKGCKIIYDQFPGEEVLGKEKVHFFEPLDKVNRNLIDKAVSRMEKLLDEGKIREAILGKKTYLIK